MSTTIKDRGALTKPSMLVDAVALELLRGDPYFDGAWGFYSAVSDLLASDRASEIYKHPHGPAAFYWTGAILRTS